MLKAKQNAHIIFFNSGFCNFVFDFLRGQNRGLNRASGYDALGGSK